MLGLLGLQALRALVLKVKNKPTVLLLVLLARLVLVQYVLSHAPNKDVHKTETEKQQSHTKRAGRMPSCQVMKDMGTHLYDLSRPWSSI